MEITAQTRGEHSVTVTDYRYRTVGNWLTDRFFTTTIGNRNFLVSLPITDTDLPIPNGIGYRIRTVITNYRSVNYNYRFSVTELIRFGNYKNLVTPSTDRVHVNAIMKLPTVQKE